MKAQISLEFLIIFAIFLAMLVVSIISLVYIKDKGDTSLEEQKIKLAAQEIANTLNNVCILGNGNSRSLDIQLNNYSLEMPDSQTLRLIYNNNSVAEKVLCEFNEGTYSNTILISCCDQGTVIIE